jgi:hypothetical protein
MSYIRLLGMDFCFTIFLKLRKFIRTDVFKLFVFCVCVCVCVCGVKGLIENDAVLD